MEQERQKNPEGEKSSWNKYLDQCNEWVKELNTLSEDQYVEVTYTEIDEWPEFGYTRDPKTFSQQMTVKELVRRLSNEKNKKGFIGGPDRHNEHVGEIDYYDSWEIVKENKS